MKTISEPEQDLCTGSTGPIFIDDEGTMYQFGKAYGVYIKRKDTHLQFTIGHKLIPTY